MMRSLPRDSYSFNENRNGNSHHYQEDEQFEESGEKSQIYERSPSEQPKGWDVFTVTPSDDDDETLSSKWIETILKCLKAITYVITFFVVLSCAVVSKGIVLFMTSIIRPNRTVSLCNQGIPGLERDKKYLTVFQHDDPERIVWIWSLFFILIVPEFMTLFRCSRICTFKSYKRPTKSTFITVLFFESLHTIGIVTLVFVILPSLDVVKGAMLTNCLCFVPGVLSLVSRHSGESKRAFKTLLDLISVISQLSAFFIWPIIATQERNNVAWSIPLVAFLVSIGWWENYVDKNSPFALIRSAATIKNKLHRTRHFTYIFVSIWKIMLIFITMIISLYLVDGSVMAIFSKFKTSFSQHPILIQRDKSDLVMFANTDQFVGIEGETFEINSRSSIPYWFIFVQISATWICYVFGKFACKICIQGFSFAFPISLTVPVTISALIGLCGVHFENKCKLSDFFVPKYLFWYCHEEPFLNNEPFFNVYAIMWLLWLLSQTWIAIHIWTPKCERLATTEKLFVNPMYCSVIIDQSIAFNRRRDDEEEIKSEDINLEGEGPCVQDTSQHYETISENLDDKKKSNTFSSDQIIRIYACATMWHETAEEMIQMLKSVIRMDEDQSARRNAQKYLRIVDPDYYEFEVHIFFDDAFELSDENEDEMVVNRFVKQLVSVIDTAASNVHQTNIRLKPPKKYPTPYGGRLEWILPGHNKLIAHLKDKCKIRHRKRWSQVMYMYYLLGHRLMELPIDVNRKAVIAENTFILTLDGDINFRPHAVQLLVDLMKKNRNLGAACGRIHPVGTGPMCWYQKFEYAIGHWLQKATEHMIGCVLCSPGCFSLFRAKGLMDDNVLRRYTTKSEEAIHYVQFDQGEDRWLCTLLLQRGYRVEYSAASDAYTHCPEGFGEFYTQRRRWAPSTMANIMDLLTNYRQTVKVNDSISLPYIIYQGMLMVGTILGPGTIFLMLVGAMVAVFRISNWNSFYLNLIPILIFIIICFTSNNDVQILVAQIMSASYALLMMAVFVGQAIQMTEDGIGSPSAIFFLALSGSFVVAALLHPQEFSCLAPALLYLLSIPCMYLLLIIYSLINLNVVTWGTREVQTKKTKKELEEERQAQEDLKNKSLLGFLNLSDQQKEEGSITFNLANLFKCMLCTYPKPNEESIHLIKIQDQLDKINNKITNLEKFIDPMPKRRTSIGRSARFSDNLSTVTENEEDDEFGSESDDNIDDKDSSEQRHKRDDLLNPYWIEDKALKNGPVAYLLPSETTFWKDLIEKYLHPLEQNKDHQARVAMELKELRNRVVFAFFMLNALFILVVFLLQLNKDILHVDWPLGVRENITINPETNEYIVDKEYLEMEPIGLVFVVFFAVILIIQFVGMLFHRFGTLSHILASVELSWCSQKVKDINEEAFLNKHAIQIAKDLQRLKGIDEDDRSDDSIYGNRIEKRQTIHNLERRKQGKPKIGTLDVAFRKRFMNISAKIGEGTPVLGKRRTFGRETLNALEKRRNQIAVEQKKMQTLGTKNEFTRNKASRSTLDSKNRNSIFSNNGGVQNKGFEDDSDDELGSEQQQLHLYAGGSTNTMDRHQRLSHNL